MEVTMMRRPDGGFAPYGDESVQWAAKVKSGRLVRGKFTQIRNYSYHKRFFALVEFAYDVWVETIPSLEYKGERVQPNKERFRHDLTILAGYYEPIFDIRGELRLQAKSISFGSMEQEEFEKLNSATINAVLQKILTNSHFTDEQVRKHVDNVMQFD